MSDPYNPKQLMMTGLKLLRESMQAAVEKGEHVSEESQKSLEDALEKAKRDLEPPLERTKSNSQNNDSMYSTKDTGQNRSRCGQCGMITADDDRLPFYEKRQEPIEQPDGTIITGFHYCGCRGFA